MRASQEFDFLAIDPAESFLYFPAMPRHSISIASQAPFWDEIVHRASGDAPLGRVHARGQLRANRGLTKMRQLSTYALVYIVSGRGRFESPVAGQHELNSGDVILVFPGKLHRYEPDPDSGWAEIYLLFDGPVFDLWQDQRVICPECPIFHAAPVAEWARRISEILPIPGDSRFSATASVQAVCRLQHLLADMLALQRPPLGYGDEAWLDQARALLETLPYPGLALIAAQTGTNPDSFRKRFRALSGETVSAYRAQFLVRRAKSLLEQQRLRDAEIADALGFHDAAHFSKRFKQLVGMAPGAFRAQLAKM
jgi:AraC-like DNA-binding protein